MRRALRYAFLMTVADVYWHHLVLDRVVAPGVLITVALAIGAIGVWLGIRDWRADAGTGATPSGAFRAGLAVMVAYLVLDGATTLLLLWQSRTVNPAYEMALRYHVLFTLSVGLLTSAGLAIPLGRPVSAPATPPARRTLWLALAAALVVAGGAERLGLLSRPQSIGLGLGLFLLGIVLLLQHRRFALRGDDYRRRGFQLRGSRDPGWAPGELAAVALVGDGAGHLEYAITGRWHGIPFVAFQYQYWIGSLKREARTVGGILWEAPDGVQLPWFRLRPASLWHRLTRRFGARDIRFPDDPSFTAAYRLEGGDDAAVRTLFAPSVRQGFTDRPGQWMAGDGRHLAWWIPEGLRQRGLPDAGELDPFLDQGHAVRRVFWP